MKTFNVDGYVPIVADVWRYDGIAHVRLLFHNAALRASFTELACSELATGADASNLESVVRSHMITCLACSAWSAQQFA